MTPLDKAQEFQVQILCPPFWISNLYLMVHNHGKIMKYKFWTSSNMWILSANTKYPFHFIFNSKFLITIIQNRWFVESYFVSFKIWGKPKYCQILWKSEKFLKNRNIRNSSQKILDKKNRIKNSCKILRYFLKNWKFHQNTAKFYGNRQNFWRIEIFGILQKTRFFLEFCYSDLYRFV